VKLAWFIILHLLGVGCIAADIAIIATLGVQDLDLSWTGWVGVVFLWWLAVGVAMGWKRFIGRPLRLIILGFYIMATLMLLGIGFSADMGQPTLLLGFAPLATALIGRIILDIVTHATRKPAASAADLAPTKRTTHDTLFNP
jgi:hypothetical protein